MKAELRWVPQSERGKKQLPESGRYITVARFCENDERWPLEAWSLIVEFSMPPSWHEPNIVDVKFLVPDAPHHLLHAGIRFTLYEGSHPTAHAKVIG